MRINELLKQIQKVALEEGINIKIIESKDIQNIKTKKQTWIKLTIHMLKSASQMYKIIHLSGSPSPDRPIWQVIGHS